MLTMPWRVEKYGDRCTVYRSRSKTSLKRRDCVRPAVSKHYQPISQLVTPRLWPGCGKRAQLYWVKPTLLNLQGMNRPTAQFLAEPIIPGTWNALPAEAVEAVQLQSPVECRLWTLAVILADQSVIQPTSVAYSASNQVSSGFLLPDTFHPLRGPMVEVC